MRNRPLLVLLAAATLVAACAAQTQMLDAHQPAAEQTALERARFEMNCPTATATVLSRDFVQPAVQGPWVEGLERAEYTIGVAGCGQRSTLVVLCQVGTDTCFAADPQERIEPPFTGVVGH